MTEPEYRDLAEALSDLKYGDQPSEDETEEANPADPAAVDEKESAPVPDKSDEEPEEVTDTEPATDPEPETDGDGGAEKKHEDKAPDAIDDPAAKLIEIDGKEYTLAEVREMRDGGLRQSDYTRKAQEAAKVRKSAEERDELVAQIVSDPSMKEMVRAHPEMLPHLLRDPVSTKALLGNPEEVQKLWDDFDVIAENPRLAERFSRKDPDAENLLAQERYRENITAVASALDGTVDAMAEKFEGVDKDDVKEYILTLGGMPSGDNVDPAAAAAAFERMFSLFFVQDGDQLKVDTRLIEQRFNELSEYGSLKKSASKADVDDHNKTVDAQLKDTAPRSTPEGNSPAPTSMKDTDEAENVNEVIRSILGYE
jgi:hypothetical protein